MNELKEFRIQHGLHAQDMVDVLRKTYPKYDKTVHSKCENTKKYGAALCPEAMKILYDTFAPNEQIYTGAPQKPCKPRKPRRSDTKRQISARLSGERIAQLQQHIKDDGYSTMQEWIAGQVDNYLSQHEKELNDE